MVKVISCVVWSVMPISMPMAGSAGANMEVPIGATKPKADATNVMLHFFFLLQFLALAGCEISSTGAETGATPFSTVLSSQPSRGLLSPLPEDIDAVEDAFRLVIPASIVLTRTSSLSVIVFGICREGKSYFCRTSIS